MRRDLQTEQVFVDCYELVVSGVIDPLRPQSSSNLSPWELLSWTWQPSQMPLPLSWPPTVASEPRQFSCGLLDLCVSSVKSSRKPSALLMLQSGSDRRSP